MSHPALAERALIDHRDLGRRGQRRLASRALDDERHRQPGAQHRRLLQVLKRRDRRAVDRLDEVARPEIPLARPATRLRRAPIRGAVLESAEDHEQRGENDEGEDEIGDRPGRDDRGAIAQRLAGQGPRPLAGRHRLDARDVRRARRVRVAVELHIAAKGKAASRQRVPNLSTRA